MRTIWRKADLCVEIAQVLVDNGVDTHTSLAVVLEESPDPEWKIRNLAGAGPAAWRSLDRHVADLRSQP